MTLAEGVQPPGVGWREDDHYKILGTPISIRTPSAQASGTIRRLLEPFLCTPAGKVAHSYCLTSSDLSRDQALILRTSSWPVLLNGLLSDLNQVAVDGFGGFAVHAGVVARGEAVIAFPAVSHAGKSTLTAACLSWGLQYVSDDALCVDFDHDAVHPYPKPLKLSRQAAALAGFVSPHEQEEIAVLPEDLGASLARGALRLRHVVQLVRRSGPPALHPLERSETIVMLLTMSFNHYRHPQLCFSLASRLALRARAWRLEYDHPRPAASLLRELADGDAAAGRSCPDR